jgi:hypothetical protein
MNDMQKVLNVLRNIKPSSKDLVKIKVMMACYDGWKSTHDIRRIANLGLHVQLRLNLLVIDHLIDSQYAKVMTTSGKYYNRHEYKISKKGIEYLIEIMR